MYKNYAEMVDTYRTQKFFSFNKLITKRGLFDIHRSQTLFAVQPPWIKVAGNAKKGDRLTLPSSYHRTAWFLLRTLQSKIELELQGLERATDLPILAGESNSKLLSCNI